MAQADYVIVTEIFYSDGWHDISADVRNREPVDIERGRPDESSKIKPGKLTFTLNNGASRAAAGIVGRYSPRNPRSDLFELIGRNTPVRQSIDGHPRFAGEISEWPTRWDLSGADVWVSVRAAGVLRRLGQGGGKTIRSAFRRRIEAVGADAYWPLDAGELAEVGEPVFGATSFQLESVTDDLGQLYQFGQSDLAPWVGPGMKTAVGGGLDAAVTPEIEIVFAGAPAMPSDGIEEWSFEWMMRFPDGPAPRGQASTADSSVETAWLLVGNGTPRVDWVISTTTDNATPSQKGWNVTAFDEAGLSLGGAAFAQVDHADGQVHHCRLLASDIPGAGIFWDFAIDGENHFGQIVTDVGLAHLRTNDDAGHAVTPDNAALDIVGDIDIRVFCSLVNWGPTAGPQCLIGKWNEAPQNAYIMEIAPSGALVFFWSPDGTTILSATSTVVLGVGGLNFGSFAQRWVRVTLDVDNGAAGRTATFFTSTDGIAWTQLGAQVVQAGVTSIFNSTAPLRAFGRGNITNTPNGRLFYTEVRNLIGGTVVASPDFRLQATGAQSFTDSAGRPWTITQPAEIEPAAWPRQGIARAEFTYRGQAPSPPPILLGHVTVRHDDSESLSSTLEAGIAHFGEPAGRRIERLCAEEGIPFTGAGDLDDSEPLGQQRIEPFLTLLDQAATADGGIIFEDREAESGGVAALFVSGAGSAATPDAAALDITGNIDIRVFCALDDWTPAANSDLIAKLATAGNQRSWDLLVTPAGELQFRFSPNGATPFTSITSSLPTGFAAGTAHWVRFTLDADDGAAQKVGTFYTSDDGVLWIQLGAVQTSAGVAVIHSGTAPLSIAANAEGGAPASGRFFYAEVRDGIAGTVVASPDFRPLQAGVTAFSDAEGLPWSVVSPALVDFHEQPGFAGLGLGYVTRRNLYNRTPVLQLDYTSGHISPPFDPTDDDQALENDVTAKRLDGGERQAVKLTGPLSVLPPPAGVGRYDRSVTLNVTDDDRLAPHAAARVEIGTLDVTRFPEVGFRAVKHPELTSSADLTTGLAAIDSGSVVTIDNPPPWLPPELIELMVQGYRERYSLTDWQVDWQTTPADPYRVGVLDVDRLDSEHATVASTFVAGTGTSLSVAWAVGSPVAAVGATDFLIRVAGVVLRVTNIAGATSPQTFTVAQVPVNGVRKTIPAGSPVRLAQPWRLAF